MQINASDLRFVASFMLPVLVACVLLPNTIKVMGKTVACPVRWVTRYYLRAMRPW